MAGSATRPPRSPRSEDPQRSQADRVRRREERRRQLRRRRLTALAAAIGVLVLVVVAIAALAGGGDDKGSQSAAGGGARDTAWKQNAGPFTTSEYRHQSRAITKVLAYTPFVSRGSPRKREVAITLDDGPGPLTPDFVRTLQHLHAPATFFVVGQQLNAFGAGLRDAIRAGFAIGDHTEQHANMPSLPASKQAAQIRDAALRIRSYGVPLPRLFRPPGGAFDATTLRELKAQRMLSVLWSVDTYDYTRPGTHVIVSRALHGAKPGAIILMHDGGGDRSQTLAALPAIIRGLRSKGFALVTVPQLLLHDPPPRQQARPTSPGA